MRFVGSEFLVTAWIVFLTSSQDMSPNTSVWQPDRVYKFTSHSDIETNCPSSVKFAALARVLDSNCS